MTNQVWRNGPQRGSGFQKVSTQDRLACTQTTPPDPPQGLSAGCAAESFLRNDSGPAGNPKRFRPREPPAPDGALVISTWNGPNQPHGSRTRLILRQSINAQLNFVPSTDPEQILDDVRRWLSAQSRSPTVSGNNGWRRAMCLCLPSTVLASEGTTAAGNLYGTPPETKVPWDPACGQSLTGGWPSPGLPSIRHGLRCHQVGYEPPKVFRGFKTYVLLQLRLEHLEGPKSRSVIAALPFSLDQIPDCTFMERL